MPKPRSPAAPTRGGAHATRERITAPRELVVMMDADVDLHAAPTGLASARGADLAPLERVLDAGKAALGPLFGLTEERLRQRAAATARGRSPALPDLAAYYRVDAPAASLDDLADQLRRLPSVRAAYVKPATELPMHIGADALPLATEAPPSTPDFNGRQGYLDAAPGGIDARYAWTRAGGRGSNVRIIDIEGAWRFSHEDLKQNQGGVVAGVPPNNALWLNHGTAVVGVFSGDGNSFGITGACPDASVRAVSIFGQTGSAAAIRLMILRRLGRSRLEQLLQLAFRVFEDGNHRQPAEGRLELAEDEVAGGLEAAVEEDRAQQRLVSVGQRGGPLPAAVQLLAPAQDQVLANAKVPGAFGQGPAVDELGAGLGQRAFAEGGEFLIQLAREHELQDGVAQEFEALIGLDGRALFMRDRGMGQGELQQGGIAKDIAQPVLQFLVSGDGGHGAVVQARECRSGGLTALRVQPALADSGTGAGRSASWRRAQAAVSGGGAGGFKPCSSRAATSRWTCSSWLSCKAGSMMVKTSPVAGCS